MTLRLIMVVRPICSFRWPVPLATLLATLLTISLSAQEAPPLYDIENITEVNVMMIDSAWEAKLIAYKDANVKKRVLASLEVNGMSFDSVGVRFKGNSSYFRSRQDGTTKLPLNIKLSYTDEDQVYPGGYRTLKLSNVFRDPSFVREALAYHVARTYVPAPKANFAKVTVNGKYWGLYTLTQSIDEQFQKEHYGSRKGVLFKCDPDRKVDKGTACAEGELASLEYLGPDQACYQDRYEIKRSKAGYDDIIELIRLLNTDLDAFAQIFDIDGALWMHAFNNVMVNLDSYTGLFCHNYYLYQDKKKIWHPLLWDMNMALGGFRFTGIKGNPKLSNEQMGELSIFMHLRDRSTNRPLITELLSIPLYRKMYVAHCKTIFEDFIAQDQYREVAESYREMIRPLVKEDPEKLYSFEQFEKNYTETVTIEGSFDVVGVTELMDGRKKYFSDHVLMTTEAPEILANKVAMQGADSKVTATLAEADEDSKMHVWFRTVENGPWKLRQMETDPDTENGFFVLLPGEIHSYYLVAENKVVASVLPERSAKEWFEVEGS
ncbi:hypothetical protein CEQ90_03605 [Lewinellaceae bacterium SD302]|nr:hypothetical protein CEQ90_03605 [Lewinellaceae bacterium SD302]